MLSLTIKENGELHIDPMDGVEKRLSRGRMSLNEPLKVWVVFCVYEAGIN